MDLHYAATIAAGLDHARGPAHAMEHAAIAVSRAFLLSGKASYPGGACRTWPAPALLVGEPVVPGRREPPERGVLRPRDRVALGAMPGAGARPNRSSLGPRPICRATPTSEASVYRFRTRRPGCGCFGAAPDSWRAVRGQGPSRASHRARAMFNPGGRRADCGPHKPILASRVSGTVAVALAGNVSPCRSGGQGET